MIDEIFDKLSLIKALTFSFASSSKEIGQYPDELKNFANVLHFQILELEDLLEKDYEEKNKEVETVSLVSEQSNVDD